MGEDRLTSVVMVRGEQKQLMGSGMGQFALRSAE